MKQKGKYVEGADLRGVNMDLKSFERFLDGIPPIPDGNDWRLNAVRLKEGEWRINYSDIPDLHLGFVTASKVKDKLLIKFYQVKDIPPRVITLLKEDEEEYWWIERDGPFEDVWTFIMVKRIKYGLIDAGALADNAERLPEQLIEETKQQLIDSDQETIGTKALEFDIHRHRLERLYRIEKYAKQGLTQQQMADREDLDLRTIKGDIAFMKKKGGSEFPNVCKRYLS